MPTATSTISPEQACAQCLRRSDPQDWNGRDLCSTCWKEFKLVSSVRSHMRDLVIRDAAKIISLGTVSSPHGADQVVPVNKETPVNEGRPGADHAPRVLVVEDRKYLRDTTTAILSDEGYDVIDAVDGVEALEKLRARNVDVMLLDLHLPRKDGTAVLEELPRPLAVVVCSAFEDYDEGDLRERFGSTVVEFLQKPVPPSRLLAATAAAAAQGRALAG